MSHIADFLNALFSNSTAPVVTVAGDQEGVLSNDLGAYQGARESVLVRPETENGQSFVWSLLENVDADEHRTFLMQSSAVLYRAGDRLMISCWALAAPERGPKVRALSETLGMQSADDPVPLPETGGWELVHADADCTYALTDLYDAYVSGGASAQFLGARIVTPFDSADPAYDQNMIVTVAGKSFSMNWTPQMMPVRDFLTRICEHREGQKDGPAFVLAEMMTGRRLNASVKANYGIGLDVDNGFSSENLDKALAGFGHLAVRYTTHSHLKTTSDFAKSRVLRFCEGKPINDSVMRDYVIEERGWAPEIAETLRFIDFVQPEQTVLVRCEHTPMPKNRVIIPLLTPYSIKDQPIAQVEALKAWAKIPEAVTHKLKIPVDVTCFEAGRLFYFPRHTRGSPFEISIFGGSLFDWQTLTLSDSAFERAIESINKSGKKSVTPTGQELGRWAVKRSFGFQINDVIDEYAPEKVRGPASVGYSIECPFDEEHSNAGDQQDRACFSVNAGDSSTEMFTISCRHAGCQRYTNLDMLGKMLVDDWFPRFAIEDEKFCALITDEDDAKKIVAQVNTELRARKDYNDVVEAVQAGAGRDEIENALRMVLDANLSNAEISRVKKILAKKLGADIGSLTADLKRLDAIRRGRSIKDANQKSPNVFHYAGAYNFDDATKFCHTTLEKVNENANMPLFSCSRRQPLRLWVEPDSKKGSFEELNSERMWAELSKYASFVRKAEKGDSTREKVPEDVAKYVSAQCYEALPPMPEVIYTPIFLPDGELLHTPGYVRRNSVGEKPVNILFIDNGLAVSPVPKKPTRRQMEAARDAFIEELLSDFPFLDQDEHGEERREPSQANAISMILTPFMRRMIDGLTPLFFIHKPQSGTGGTFLGQLPLRLFDGEAGGITRYSQSEDEMQKELVASLRETRTHLLFDDVKEFNNRVLLRALTSAKIGGRVLGSSTVIELPNIFNWIATGNNPDIRDEMARRIVWTRLNAKTANINDRVFKHPNYEAYVRENRGQFIGKILTMIQYWNVEGQPEYTDRTRASYEDWARKVGGVLQCCGIEGFLGDLQPINQDSETSAYREFIREWVKKYQEDVLVKGAQLFEWAIDKELDIVQGNNELQRKSKFFATLRGLEGRTFRVRFNNSNERSYMVQAVMNDEQDVCHKLTRVETPVLVQ